MGNVSKEIENVGKINMIETEMKNDKRKKYPKYKTEVSKINEAQRTLNTINIR
jgi:hypothetical protein